MAHVLVIMTPARHCEMVVEQAMQAAALGDEGGRVTLVWLMDEDRSEHIRDCLESRGFVGSGPAANVTRLMKETSSNEGQRQLDELKERGEAKGLNVITSLVVGHLEETVLELYAEHAPDRVYLPGAKLGPLVRLFGERAIKRLRKRLGDVLVTL